MNLRPEDRAIFEEIYPVMFDAEERLNCGLALALWANLTRLLATRGIPANELHELLAREYGHQVEYNARQL